MTTRQQLIKQQEAMANKEVLDAIAASTKTYLEAVAESKEFYATTIKATEERITGNINKVITDVKKNTQDISKLTVRVGNNEATIAELVAFKKEHEERTITMENRSVMGEYP